MWNIKLDDKYWVQSDRRQLILGTKTLQKNKKTGEQELCFNAECFCSSLSGILDAYKERKLKTADITSFEDVLKYLKELEKQIQDIDFKLDTGVSEEPRE